MRALAAAALAALLSACSAAAASGPNRGALARSATVESVAAGQVQALPTGPVFARIGSFVQQPHTAFSSASHVEGFDFVLSGAQRLTYASGQMLDIEAGQAVFQRSEAHTHANAGSLANHWLAIAMWPAQVRGLPGVNPLQVVVFESENVGGLPAGTYVETLQLVKLARGGRTEAQSHGGLEVVYVLDGSVSLHRAGGAPATIPAEEGTLILAHTPVQLYAEGGPATYMAFYVTELGEPFSSPVGHPL